MEIQENVPLSTQTTFKFGGPARYFIEAKTDSDLREAFHFAKGNRLPFFVLAGGSNLIVSSKGFNGVVVKVLLDKLEIEGNTITAGAAVDMKVLVDSSIEKGLSGLEWAGGLPGTFGGAIRGNAGAFKGEIKDTIESVTSLNLYTNARVVRKKEDCEFVYRGSFFKDNPSEVILWAKLKLNQGKKKDLRNIADNNIAYRKKNHPMEYPCAGSIFKNTPVEKVPKEFLDEFSAVIKNDPFPVVPTAAIIAKVDVGGMKIGKAQVSLKHTNYIINLGNATGEDVLALINTVKDKVRAKYRIELEVEPELVGF